MIMESTTNLHHLQQDQPSPVVDPSSSSLSNSNSNSNSTPSYATTHSWNPNITLNNAGNFNSNLQEATNTRSRSCLIAHKNEMIQDLGYNNQWITSDATAAEFSKEEISFANFPKFTEMLNYTTPNNSTMLKTLLTEQDFYSSQSYNNPNFGATNHIASSQIHPSINISNFNHYSSSTTLDMNMQSLDLLTTSPTSFTNTSHPHFGKFTNHDNNLSFHLHPMHHSTNNSSSSNQSLLSNIGTVETKRGCTLMESKASQSQTALKKSRSSSESRPSCPPFKVRKEKLGDRIAALQQLVAPFGKTDTASVLMEAIGYIKFLQGQIETLSVPYMKSSQNQNNRVMRGGTTTCDTNGEPKQDLRSRGLCLVPLSCMSYIATDGGTEAWQQHHNFGRPT